MVWSASRRTLEIVFASVSLMAQPLLAQLAPAALPAAHFPARVSVWKTSPAATGWFEYVSLPDTRASADLPSGSDPSSATALPDAPDALQPQPQKPNPGTPAAQAPLSSSDPRSPSLSDLGLAPSQTQGNAQQQALLDKRARMLKIHQRLGLLTTIPLAATLISSGSASNDRGSHPGVTTGTDVHAAIGGVAIGMYAATAYYAIRAPRVEGTQTRGAIRLHKTLAWIHGPGMVLTPILGVMAYNQENNGERVHGIASAHAPVAWITTLAYGAAILSVSWPLKNPF